jgi:putative flippase GtrA
MRRDSETFASAARFVLVGIANTFTGLLIIYALKWTLGASDLFANLAGYAGGLCLSFLLNARWTFAYRGSLSLALPRFALIIGIAYAANLIAVYATLGAGINGYVAQAIGVLPYAAITFLGSKLFVFAKQTPQTPG